MRRFEQIHLFYKRLSPYQGSVVLDRAKDAFEQYGRPIAELGEFDPAPASTIIAKDLRSTGSAVLWAASEAPSLPTAEA